MIPTRTDIEDTHMNAHRNENPKNKRGAHRYEPEDFGLTREQLDRDFAPYRERYGIERQS